MATNKGLTIYGHILSPFSSFVRATAEYCNIEFTYYTVNLARGEHKRDWFLKINPKGQIPAIKDDDHCLAESIEIARYLIKSREVDTPLYPYSDPAKIKEIDGLFEEFKDLEPATMEINMKLWAAPYFFGTPRPSEEKIQTLMDDLYEQYQKLDDHLSKSETKYLTSDETPTLIDFWVFMLIYKLTDNNGLSTVDNHPNLAKWFRSMNEIAILSTLRGQGRRMLRFVNFIFGYVMPVVNCIRCKRRRQG
ncbi:unnamed protein product [Moneuplotes crassus]|uniref:Glutathione S-transferase n=1 Tax=Euplotes crassus TaxID=5936 RepID=A0AAD1XUB7_EUPCR|nr:unnamed protein product [Moneuplotes crassus]